MTANALQLDDFRVQVLQGLDDEQACSDVVDACHVLAAYGYNDYVWGHVATRAAHDRGIWMKPVGVSMDQVTVGDVILVGWDGQVLEGRHRVHPEYHIHTQLLRARPDVAASVHSHAGRSTIFASLGEPLRPVCREAIYFAPHGVAHFGETSELVVDADLGDSVASALGDASAIFLRGHGILTAGPDVAEATMAALLLESACRKQLAAEAAGRPVAWMSPEQALTLRAHSYTPELIRQGWTQLVRSVAMPRRSA